MSPNERFSNFLFLFLSLFFFIAIYLQTQKGIYFLKTTFSSFNSFFLNTFHSVKENTESLIENFKGLKELKKEKEELEKINLSLKAKIFNLESELQKYKKLGILFENPGVDFIVAETIGWDITNPYMGIIINKGERDGVKNYSPVLDRSFNLLGRVLRTTSHSAEVILLTSADFSASVQVGDGTFAILSGENSPSCILKYITDEESLKEGEEIYTSGYDRIFPPGLKVGVIEKIERNIGILRSVSVKPYANFKAIDLVLVLKK